jgi:hypothetical protein
MGTQDIQLSQLVDASKPKNILTAIQDIFLHHYPRRQFSIVKKCFSLISELFEGKFPGYRKCNTEYHDFNHTLDTFLATGRLLDGYNLEGAPITPPRAAELLLAALFHDTGYIQDEWDVEGTGAKYTAEHVERGIVFLKKHCEIFDIQPESAEIISRIILCTDMSVDISGIPFPSSEERVAGMMLGTADLLGQMADRVYLEKLLFLYYEFKEAGIGDYKTEYDLISRNIDFYETTKKRFNTDLKEMYRYARYHFKERFSVDKNLYIQSIDRHIAYLRKILEDDTSNWRSKLKRGNWIQKGTADNVTRGNHSGEK